jgi:hypothetical protein
MIELLESPSTVLAVRAVGRLTKEDYENVLEPAVERLVSETGELRAVIVVGDEFDSFTSGAAWEDTKFGIAHWGKWKRCAVVTDKDWVEGGVKVFGWMMPGEVKVFEDDDLDDAIEWAAE